MSDVRGTWEAGLKMNPGNWSKANLDCGTKEGPGKSQKLIRRVKRGTVLEHGITIARFNTDDSPIL